MSQDLLTLSRALAFAAETHRNQRRKGAAQEPYINHLIEVMELVARATGGEDTELLVAALLHDVIEDAKVPAEEIEEKFGTRVARMVVENTDDMRLPKLKRRAERIAGMPHKPADSRTIKMADVISNLRSVVISAPAGWDVERKLDYLEACRRLVDAGSGANAELESLFDETAAEAEAALRGDVPMNVEGRTQALRHLEVEIGQKVHLVYLPNTQMRWLTGADIQKFAQEADIFFPSAAIHEAHATFDGKLRKILLARVRTDDSDAVVAFGQRLCRAFEQDFVGIEVGGRYIRVYVDDTD
ncbi:HD domain-containing protein [Aliiruegeria sabulilitoris]|uniref:HD domain-containing protein n=1 Tax=Aliiruegeria sabulilitoris TaxID=1510458 RepID=UPI0009E8644F|nr:HD domain-containing protein [Aliiruegeria sabulilitoris]NDR59177.1 bifunctional (p)ppGpp synthetase/guanosine-3',5'-bis(diphosphate) 3'-pyrophosphohydrolase [Pseudoruegeria sp. M32A2M]